MSENAKIEWTDSTFSPWWGCQKVGPGCDNCYAESLDHRTGGAHWGPGAERRRTSVKNWNDPIRWNKKADAFFAEHGRRQRVFCASMADVFDNEVDPQWRDDLWELIWATPNLDWLLLTKRIGNVGNMLPVPFDFEKLYPNVWIGATICNQVEADRDIPKLLAVPAHKRFLSMEPLLGPVDLGLCNCDKGSRPGPAGVGGVTCAHCNGSGGDMVDQVIVGGESGPKARPMHPDWARSLRDQCEAAGVPFLFKQWGEYLPIGQSLPDHGKVHGATGVKPGRMKLHYGGTPNQAPKFAFADHGVEVRSFDDTRLTCRVGKKAAGRLLDGREWNGVPA